MYVFGPSFLLGEGQGFSPEIHNHSRHTFSQQSKEGKKMSKWLKFRNSLNPIRVGPYGIPISLLKLLCEHVSFPLCEIINESFVSGIFLDILKVGKVIPLYKKQSPYDPSNYRPISFLSIFSKLIEKLMYTRLYNFLEDDNVFYFLQFGFRAKHSTLHALISMTECIKKTIDDGMSGIGVFIDFQKVFDTVNHFILLKKTGTLWNLRRCIRLVLFLLISKETICIG